MKLLITTRELDTVDKIHLIVSYALQAVLFVTLVISLVRQDWLTAFAVIGILILTFLPSIIRRSYRVFLPLEFDVAAIIFIFAALFLGELHGYYTKFWWWDLVLHTSSGFLFGILGFLLLYVLSNEPRVYIRMKPGFVAMFGFTFAVAIGVVWEIFEFFMDSTFGLGMQKSGSADTMWDLIVDALGALVIAVLGYLYLRKGNLLLFDRMIHRFVEKNPKLVRKKKQVLSVNE